MKKETANVIFIENNNRHFLLIPLFISANDLAVGLKTAFECKNENFDVRNCYLASENPIALLHGTKTIAEYGIHDGSIISFAK